MHLSINHVRHNNTQHMYFYDRKKTYTTYKLKVNYVATQSLYPSSHYSHKIKRRSNNSLKLTNLTT